VVRFYVGSLGLGQGHHSQGALVATTTTQPNNSARTVVGLIGFAVLFSLVGNEIQIAQASAPGPGQSGYGVVAPGVTVTPEGQPVGGKFANGLDKGAVIIIGGFVAAALLTALSGAGDAGRRFSVGLATVTAVTSALVYGGPVWQALGNVVGGKATTPTGATGATTPTSGTATAVALTSVVGG
jgi:hypothetical protein